MLFGSVLLFCIVNCMIQTAVARTENLLSKEVEVSGQNSASITEEPTSQQYDEQQVISSFIML